MDPNATWKRLLEEIAGQTWANAAATAEDLMGWLQRGGFPPDVFSERPLAESWNRALARFTCELVLTEAGDRRGRMCE